MFTPHFDYRIKKNSKFGFNLMDIDYGIKNTMFKILEAADPDGGWKTNKQIYHVMEVDDWDEAAYRQNISEDTQNIKFPFATLTNEMGGQIYDMSLFPQHPQYVGEGEFETLPIQFQVSMRIYLDSYDKCQKYIEILYFLRTIFHGGWYKSSMFEEKPWLEYSAQDMEYPSYKTVPDLSERLAGKGSIFSVGTSWTIYAPLIVNVNAEAKAIKKVIADLHSFAGSKEDFGRVVVGG